jgi:hypothetical protein
MGHRSGAVHDAAPLTPPPPTTPTTPHLQHELRVGAGRVCDCRLAQPPGVDPGVQLQQAWDRLQQPGACGGGGGGGGTPMFAGGWRATQAEYRAEPSLAAAWL